MKILILGGTGLVGNALVEHLGSQHHVKAFGRKIYENHSKLQSETTWADLVIQLSGANISKRWTKSYKKQIWDSRIETNNQLVEVFNNLEKKPKLIFASAVGFYPESDCHHPLDESDLEHGDDFLALLANEWEKTAKKIHQDVLIFRFGVVLSKQGGALKEMLPMYKLGLGGPINSGSQCFPWVYMKDLIRAFDFGIEHNLTGTFNLTSPQIISQKQFGRAFAQSLKRPFFIKTFSFQLKLIFGQGADVLVKSLSVYPTKLLKAGFKFKFEKIDDAFLDIFHDKKL